MAATPARSAWERKRPRASGSSEFRGLDMDRQQYELAAYDDPQPSAAWMHSYYVCGCGFEQAQITGFQFNRVPHRCRS